MTMHKPPHPGPAIAEAVEHMGLTVEAFAVRIGTDAEELGQVLAGQAPVTPDLSHKITQAFGQPTSDIWHRMQAQYDGWQAIKGALGMVETLYRVPNAGEGVKVAKPEDLAHAEYRELVLTRDEEDRDRWTLKVFQGWWDATTRRPVMNSEVLVHTFDSWDEGEAAYLAQLGYAVTDGFCYSYTFNPEAEDLCSIAYIGK